MKKALLQILKPIWGICWASLDSLVLSRRHPANGTRALLVRVDAIGDFVLWSDAGRALSDFLRAQGRSVVLLGNQSWATWAEEMRLADEVWSLDTRRFARSLRYRWMWLRKLRAEGFAVAIGPTYSRDFLIHDSLIRASGARDRIGYDGDCSNIRSWFKSWSDRWYTRLISGSVTSISELKRNAEFTRAVGPADFLARVPVIMPSEHKRLPDVPTEPYAVLFPGASWIGKAWPVARFAEIGRRFMKLGYKIVVAGGPADGKFAAPLVEALHDNVCDLCGKTSLSDLAEVLRRSAAIVTNDTSVLHIGAAVGVPVVCILGGGHFGRFAPYDVEISNPTRPLPYFAVNKMDCFGCNWHCHYSREKNESVLCIRDVPTDEVWRLVEKALASRTLRQEHHR